jgi:hypothetical protein
VRTLRSSGHAQETFRVRERLRELELGTLVSQRAYVPLPTQPAGPLYRAGQNMSWGPGWGADSSGALPISAQSDAYGYVNLVGTAMRNPNTQANHPAPGWTILCYLPAGYAPSAGRELAALIGPEVVSPMRAVVYAFADATVQGYVYGSSTLGGWARVSIAGRYSIA